MRELDVFLSWSKPGSKTVALTLKEWLPKVVPHTKYWVSSVDIAKGKPWFPSIADQLTTSLACITCFTPENLRSPWLFWEAGAIAHSKKDPLICSFLFRTPNDAISKTPLSMYQTTTAEMEETYLLLKSLNSLLSQPHHETLLRTQFEHNWPELEVNLSQIVIPKTKPRGLTGTFGTPGPIGSFTLSNQAKEILVFAADANVNPHGMLMMFTESDGLHVGNIMVPLSDPNYGFLSASYEAAVETLCEQGHLKNVDLSGESYKVTPEGYQLAGELIAMNLKPAKVQSDNDYIVELQSYVSNCFKNFSTTIVVYQDVDKEHNYPIGTAKRFLPIAAQKQGWTIETPGDSKAVFRHTRIQK